MRRFRLSVSRRLPITRGPHQAFLPEVLKHYDLPELAAGLTMPTLITNPLDATRQPVGEDEFRKLYAQAAARGDAFEYRPGQDTGAIQGFVGKVNGP